MNADNGNFPGFVGWLIDIPATRGSKKNSSIAADTVETFLNTGVQPFS